jgi:hypothetical protein
MSSRSEISAGVGVVATRRMTWGMSSRNVERSRATRQLLRSILITASLRFTGASRRFRSCSITVR